MKHVASPSPLWRRARNVCGCFCDQGEGHNGLGGINGGAKKVIELYYGVRIILTFPVRGYETFPAIPKKAHLAGYASVKVNTPSI